MNRYNQDMPTDARLYDTAEMDGVVVWPDAVALRFLELNYTFGTHFMPNGLPGIGETTADLISGDGKTSLILPIESALANVVALHLVRQEEGLYRRWYKERVALAERTRSFL